MVFHPGDPWPDTTFPGGAVSPSWSGYLRLIVRAAIAPGTAFKLGQSASDRLNDGNVMSQPGGLPLAATELEGEAVPLSARSGLWVDLTCDLVDLETSIGAASSSGVLSKAEAGTLTATLYDPTGKYDPLNPSGPYSLAGITRLLPGIPVEAFAELVTTPGAASPGLQRWPLFTGTVDRWEADWPVDPGDRRVKMVATDTTKQFVKFNAPEQPPTGDGDGIATRLNRIVNLFGWTGGIASWGTSTRTLQATTLAQSAWEMVNRVLDDEIGFVYFPPASPTSTVAQSPLTWFPREQWSDNTRTPQITLGCGGGVQEYDIATSVAPAALDDLLHNQVNASRSGGTMQTAQNPSSVARYGPQTLQRSDLGLRDDTQVAAWAQAIVNLQSFPTTALDHVTMEPAIWQPDPWSAWVHVFQTTLFRDVARILYDELGYSVDFTFRVVGVQHHVTRSNWEVTWQTVRTTALPVAVVFTLGPDARDRLNAGFLLGG